MIEIIDTRNDYLVACVPYDDPLEGFLWAMKVRHMLEVEDRVPKNTYRIDLPDDVRAAVPTL